jgi:hypothetical protein
MVREHGPPVSRVLVPRTADELSRAFDLMRPTWVLRSGGIDKDHVHATLCFSGRGPAGCSSILLTDPTAGCAGELVGPWCLTFPDAAARADPGALLRSALASVDGDLVWQKLEIPPAETDDVARQAVHEWPAFVVEASGAGSRARDVLGLVATVLGLLVGPAAGGALAGAVFRRLGGRRLRGGGRVVVAVALPAALCIVAMPRSVGIWDAAMEGVLAGAGFVWSTHAALEDRSTRVLAIGATVASLLVFECAVRLLLPPPPGFMSPLQTRFLRSSGRRVGLANGGAEAVCNAVYGAGWSTGTDEDGGLPWEHPVPTGYRRRVLHLGDSMTADVNAFPGMLQAAEPGTLHVNGAAPAIGPDGYLVLMRQWTQRVHFDLVVMSLFAGNDFDDIDNPYPCCAWQPILTYAGFRPELSCRVPTTLEAAMQLPAYVAQSPPPYLLRVASAVSAGAAYSAATFALWSRPVANDGMTADRRDKRAHLAAILRAARDELAERGTALVVVVLPERAALEGEDRTSIADGRAMHEIAESLGIVVLDAWEPLQLAVRDPHSDPLFVDVIHFTRAGHAVVAAWLHERLPEAERAARQRVESPPSGE